jgi:hypothetical protein
MITTNRIVAIALITALIGASLGAAVMHSRGTSGTATTIAKVPEGSPAWDTAANAKYIDVTAAPVPTEFNNTDQQTAYKVGFADGFRAAADSNSNRTAQVINPIASAPTLSNASGSRRSYDHARPQGRSFWNKHRDKLTMAMGTGGGALIGGLIGGKKGLAIGSLAGLGGSALYTYKLRQRNHR